MTTDQIRVRLAELDSQLRELALIDGDLDETQRATWTEGTTERDQLVAEQADRAARTAFLANNPAVTVETGDGAQAVSNARDAQIMRTSNDVDIYDRSDLHVENPDDGGAYRDRAFRAIEGWQRNIPAEWRESAEALVADADMSRTSREIAEHVLKFSNPTYVRAWYKAMRPDGALTLSDVERAAMAEGATTTGGFMVPVFIDPSIILNNSGVTNPFRAISTVKAITTQTWKGITSAGVSAEWTSEASEMTDASPVVAQPTITPVRADAYVQASWELLEDTSIATELGMLFADARDRLEGTAFAVGTGSTQPRGIVTALGLVTASRIDSTTNGSYGFADVFALDNGMAPRFRANASWVANKSYWNRTRLFASGGLPAGAFWTDLGGGRPASLIGYPVYEASAMQSTISAATASSDDVVVLGDFRAGYYIVDRIGMSVAQTAGLGVIGTNRRPTGETGFAAFWRVGADCVVPEAFRMLRL
jgi:HK97 family phage major capsid protein